MFGYKLVKKRKLYELYDKVNELHGHVFRNGGFVDENGELHNSDFSKTNETRLTHWKKYNELSFKIYDILKELYK